MALNSKQHYIVLLQTSEASESRRFSDYDSLYACMEGIAKLFDDYLKTLHPHEHEITYDVAALLKFITNLKDISCLVYNKTYNMYQPQGKEWILEQVYNHLSNPSDQ